MDICLYGASSTQIDEKYIAATEILGEAMAKAGHRMVYGGGGAGLMGAAARGMKKAGGYVIGVVPSLVSSPWEVVFSWAMPMWLWASISPG